MVFVLLSYQFSISRAPYGHSGMEASITRVAIISPKRMSEAQKSRRQKLNEAKLISVYAEYIQLLLLVSEPRGLPNATKSHTKKRCHIEEPNVIPLFGVR